MPPDRTWDVSISTADETRAEAKSAREAAREEMRLATVDENARKVGEILIGFKNGETGRTIREMAGLSGKTFGTAIQKLIENGQAVACEVEKSGRKFDGYRLSDRQWD